MNSGILFVISAPSGTGKTTILKRVMTELPGLGFSVSHTTRQPRQGEVDGREYHFITRETFLGMIEADQFVEWAKVHDNYYGTSVNAVTQGLTGGADIILDIDVQGAAILREGKRLPAVHIFISPPGLDELERRLRGRNTEDEATVRLRLANAAEEMGAAEAYDYLVVNDRLDEAVRTLIAIIVAERARRRRRADGSPVGRGEAA